MSKFAQYIEDNYSTLDRIMSIAIMRYREDASVMGTLEAQIRGGKDHPMFAPGDAGARAAKALAENFQRQAEAVEKMQEELRQLIEDEETNDADLPAA